MQTDKTTDSCFILPILPHKIGNVRDFCDDLSEKYRDDAIDQFNGVGVKTIMAFLQTMPDKGDYMIFFMQSTDSLPDTIQEMFGTDDEFSKYLTDQFKDFTGIDLSKAENIPNVQELMDWKEEHPLREEKDMLLMPWCFAAALKPGMADEAMKLVEKARSMMPEATKMMRDHDIVRNLTFLQRAPQGDFLVKHIVASNPLDDLIRDFVSCDENTCKMAREMAMRLTGCDYTDPKNQPHVELLLKWVDRAGFETADQVIAYTE